MCQSIYELKCVGLLRGLRTLIWGDNEFSNYLERDWLIQIHPFSNDTVTWMSLHSVRQVWPEVDPEVQPEVHPEVHPELQPEVQPEVKPEVQPEVKPEVQQEVQPEVQ